MSLLDGLKDAMINPVLNSVTESDIDTELEFELALEAAVDKVIELSDDDIKAILDDENPDNIVSDLTSKDENPSKIAEDAMDDDLKALESMLDELLADEAMIPEEDNVEDDPESTEGCCGKALEMDDDDTEYDEDDDDEDYVSLDSLLDSIFKN